MLDSSLKEQLKAYFAKISQPIALLASVDDSAKSQEMLDLLRDIEGLSDNITLSVTNDDPRTPSFAIARTGTDIAVRFAGLPMGHEFNSLILALLQVGGHPPKEEQAVLDQIAALDGDLVFETYFSLSCQNCPDVVQALT